MSSKYNQELYELYKKYADKQNWQNLTPAPIFKDGSVHGNPNQESLIVPGSYHTSFFCKPAQKTIIVIPVDQTQKEVMHHVYLPENPGQTKILLMKNMSGVEYKHEVTIDRMYDIHSYRIHIFKDGGKEPFMTIAIDGNKDNVGIVSVDANSLNTDYALQLNNGEFLVKNANDAFIPSKNIEAVVQKEQPKETIIEKTDTVEPKEIVVKDKEPIITKTAPQPEEVTKTKEITKVKEEPADIPDEESPDLFIEHEVVVSKKDIKPKEVKEIVKPKEVIKETQKTEPKIVETPKETPKETTPKVIVENKEVSKPKIKKEFTVTKTDTLALKLNDFVSERQKQFTQHRKSLNEQFTASQDQLRGINTKKTPTKEKSWGSKFMDYFNQNKPKEITIEQSRLSNQFNFTSITVQNELNNLPKGNIHPYTVFCTDKVEKVSVPIGLNLHLIFEKKINLLVLNDKHAIKKLRKVTSDNSKQFVILEGNNLSVKLPLTPSSRFTIGAKEFLINSSFDVVRQK